MNTKLLRRIQKQILKEPRQFQMGVWFTRFSPRKIPHCGTAACIGGWAIALTKKVNPQQADAETTYEYCDAKKALGLDNIKGGRLFVQGEWPNRFRRDWREGTVAFARQAVRRIDHFIKTKGEE